MNGLIDMVKLGLEWGKYKERWVKNHKNLSVNDS